MKRCPYNIAAFLPFSLRYVLRCEGDDLFQERCFEKWPGVSSPSPHWGEGARRAGEGVAVNETRHLPPRVHP